MALDGRHSGVRRFFEATISIAAFLSGAATLILMVNIVADTALRAVLSQPIPGTFDYSQAWWLPIIVFGALGSAHRRGEHIEATVLLDLMPERIRSAWKVLGTTLIVVTLLGLVVFGWTSARGYQLIGEYASASGVLIWPARYIIPIGAAIFILQVLLHSGWERST